MPTDQISKELKLKLTSQMVMVDTRLQCAEERMGSNIKMTGIDHTVMSLAVKDTRELEGTVELRKVFLKGEKD